PRLLLTHLVDLDSMRHVHGADSPEAKAALKRLDERFAAVIPAIKEAGLCEIAFFAILGDHYQIHLTHAIRLTVLFAEKAWINE
ncbi:alkaline phosphatase family protein, partial [Listeria monocytogenes]|uniref:alkaline phosphatase family protein n=1 Tax=Listeria monocytogenes TaxID=1639 RepID=UPI001968AC63